MARPTPVAADIAHRNEVLLVGRVSGQPEEARLPSGDVVVNFRVVVARPSPAKTGSARRGPVVDTIDCAAWRADVRRVAAVWAAGDVVEVTGRLQRRFRQSPIGRISRYELEVLRARRLARVP